MQALLITGVLNALAATFVAGGALALAAAWRNPFVNRGLWLAVLLKFAIPPLVLLPLIEWPSSEEPTDASVINVGVTSQQAPIYSPSSADPGPSDVASSQRAIVLTNSPSDATVPPSLPQHDEATWLNPVPSVSPNSPLPLPQARRIRMPRPSIAPRSSWETPLDLAGILWLGGGLAFFCIALMRLVSFHRALSRAALAPDAIQRRTAELAAQAHMAPAPVVRITSGRTPPLAWRIIYGATILLPAELIDRLSEPQLDAILAHELTHLRRGDDRYRWLEFAVVTAFWWCPSAWFARRRLHEAEERCCDADVLRTFPALATHYASALLAALDCLAPAPRHVVGTPFFNRGSLVHRFESITASRRPSRPPRAMQWLLGVAGTAILVITPIAASADGDAEDSAPSPATRASQETDSTPAIEPATAGNEEQSANAQADKDSETGVEAVPNATDETSSLPTPRSRPAARPKLEIMLDGDRKVSVGGEARLRIVVRNAGTATAHGVRIVDRLDDGLVSQRFPKIRAITFTGVGTLKPGDKRELTARYDVIVGSPGHHVFAVCEENVITTASFFHIPTDGANEGVAVELDQTLTVRLPDGKTKQGRIVADDRGIPELVWDAADATSGQPRPLLPADGSGLEMWGVPLDECLALLVKNNRLGFVPTEEFHVIRFEPRPSAAHTLNEACIGLTNLFRDVQDAYWELWYCYKNLDAAKGGRDLALETWRRVKTLQRAGSVGGEDNSEAESRAHYYLLRARVEAVRSELFRVENRLRYLLGLAAEDGRLIRPSDEPTTAAFKVDVEALKAKAKTRIELVVARQKARHADLLLARADAILADVAASDPRRSEREDEQRAAATLADEQKRKADDIELEILHQLHDAIRDVELNHAVVGTNRNRRTAAADEVSAVGRLYEVGQITLDRVLLAQIRQADAESAYARSLADYSRAIERLHYRTGVTITAEGYRIDQPVAENVPPITHGWGIE
jgi:uncharacterized repeat protein (TIGR01451 family)